MELKLYWRSGSTVLYHFMVLCDTYVMLSIMNYSLTFTYKAVLVDAYTAHVVHGKMYFGCKKEGWSWVSDLEIRCLISAGDDVEDVLLMSMCVSLAGNDACYVVI